MRSRFMVALTAALLGPFLIAAPASAAQPEMERISLDDLFVAPFLSDACGVEVHGQVTGHLTLRLFTDADGNPVREVDNGAIDVRLWSVYGEIHAKNAGVDRVTYVDDGSVVIVSIGNVNSFSVSGDGRVYSDVGRSLLVIDANGDETFTPLNGQHDRDQLGAICSVLGA
jgi:hypothetical protein